jgi:hypothetical protein
MSDERIAAMRKMPEGEDGLIARAVDALFDQWRLPAGLEADRDGRLLFCARLYFDDV